MTKLGNDLLEAAKEMVKLAADREGSIDPSQVRVIDEEVISPVSLSDGSGSPIPTDPVPSITKDTKSALESISEALVAIAHNTAHIAEMMEAQYFLMAQSMGMDVGEHNRSESDTGILLTDEEGNQVKGELSSDQTDKFGEGFFAPQRKGTLQ
jgi:hypothetical protein